MSRLALIFHMNLDHANLRRSESLDLVDEHLEEMLGNIRFPFNLSSTARDWLLIQKLNPRLLDMIRSNPHIHVLNGTFSHAIPTLFPGYLDDQISYGNRSHTDIFGPSLSCYGLSPEFAMDSYTLPSFMEVWDGTLIGGTSSNLSRVCKPGDNRFTPPKEDDIYNIVPILCADGGIAVVNVARRKEVNTRFNTFFRGLNEPEHVARELRRLVEEAARSDDPLSVHLQDLETSLINKCDHNGRKMCRFDLWHELMTYLSGCGIDFVHLDQDMLDASRESCPREELYVLLPRNTDKWLGKGTSRELYEEICRVSELAGSDLYQRLALMIAMSSDVFVVLNNMKKSVPFFHARIRLRDGRYKHTKGSYREYDTLRYIETTHILHCIKNGIPVNEDMSGFPKPHQRYFQALHEILYDLM